MKVNDRLIVLRDMSRLSQQEVADAIGISKSTYCRYEQGKTTPGLEEINALLRLYNITYEDFVNLELPLKHVVSYPERLLNNLEDAIRKNANPVVLLFYQECMQHIVSG